MICQSCASESADDQNFCGHCGRAFDRRTDGRRESAERRQMTVIFADIAGSTALAERLDPEDLRDALLAYQRICTAALSRWDAHLAKYQGDGIMATLGYPIAREDDAARAVHAALELIEEVGELSAELEERLDVSFDVRVGIHTGLVVVGEMGGDLEVTDIVGETPNIAARLESVAESNTIAISHAVADLVGPAFEIESRGELPLKGVTRRIEVFRVVRAAGVDGHDGPASAAGALIGRTQELARLLDGLGRASAGRGGACRISAPAGFGKSRLVGALIELARRDDCHVDVWQCASTQQGAPLAPVVDALHRRLRGFGRGVPLGHDQVDELLTSLDAEPADRSEAVAVLDALLVDAASVAPGESSGDGLELRTRTFRLLEGVFAPDRSARPRLLVVEDAQWADPTTAELLSRIISRVAERRVFVVVASRPTRDATWWRSERWPTVELGPLDQDDVIAMIERVVVDLDGDAAARADLVRRVVEASDGVPLYVEEVAKMLVAREAIAGDEIAVPASLHGLLMARLDQLGPERDTAHLAAVFGREFTVDGLVAVRLDRVQIEDDVSKLEHHGVVVPLDGTEPGCYRFSHALIQEAAYGSLLRRRRAALHLDVARAIVNHLPQVVAADPASVAAHWSLAGEPHRASALWVVAGRRSLASAAFVEAGRHFRAALDALDAAVPNPRTPNDIEARVELLVSLGVALQAGLGYATRDVDVVYQRAGSIARQLPPARDRGVEDALNRGEFLVHLLRAEYDDALEAADVVCARAEQIEHPGLLADGHLYRGLTNMYRGEYGASRTSLEAAIGLADRRPADPGGDAELFDALGDSGVMAMAYLAPVLWALGHLDEAKDVSDRSLAAADQVARPMTFAQAWGMRSLFLHQRHADLSNEQAIEWTTKARDYAVDHEITYWTQLMQMFHAWSIGRVGDPGLALTDLDRYCDEYVASGSRLGLAMPLLWRADLLAHSGDVPGAIAAVDDSLGHIDATSEHYFESAAWRARAGLMVHGRDPDVDGAERALRRSVAVARGADTRMLELGSLTQLVTLHERIGHTDELPRSRLAELVAWFGADQDNPVVSRARHVLAPSEVRR